jgi:hypothetical protein
MQSESVRNMRHFAEVLKRLFSKGWKSEGQNDEGFWERIEAFDFDPFRYCTDAAEGQRKAFQGTFESKAAGEVFGWSASTTSRKVRRILRRTFLKN